MRLYHVAADQFTELAALPDQLPAGGFLWVGCTRAVLEARHAEVQALLQRAAGGALVDLHVSDLLNAHLPSHFDYTSWYDLLVFRRLAAGGNGGALAALADDARLSIASAKKALEAIDTSPVGFAVFDRVLVTVHPTDCAVLEHFAQRLASLRASAAGGEVRIGTRLPASPADLMLRMVNHMVDGYLDLRRLLTRQLGYLQSELLDPKSRFRDWRLLLDARNALHLLEDTCEDQRAAVQEWIDAIDEWPAEAEPEARRERELLRVRSRDVLEHVERVLTHVRRLEQSAETAVQMHFSALGHRTNDIMRTLTVLTAVFLPLNLITGFFGMNFEFMPLIHTSLGFWIAVGLMALVGGSLAWFFWRKRYIGTSAR
jgi:Mg2+ and Co2+ transporter CorA